MQKEFDFDLCKRNAFLETKGLKQPPFTKTGTTIVGLIFKDGVVLGADTRSTGGTTVMDKNCEKIHYIAPNIYCCGAGTAADTENTTDMISGELELERLATGTDSRVVSAMTRIKNYLFKYQGHVSAALVLGGVDVMGPALFMIYPHGSTDRLPFATMGSGSLAAMSVFETGYKEDLSRGEAIELVKKAIFAGIFNDLGSGSNIDVTIITKEGVEKMRNVEIYNKRTYTKQYDFPRGTTSTVPGKLVPLTERVVVEEVVTAMEVQ